MGAVYEAQPLDRPGQMVAVKLLHDEMAASPQVVERFVGEGDVCRKLDHPGILRVTDVGDQGGVPFLVMELLQGRALIDYTEHQQKLPVNFAVTVCAGVLHALDYAHQMGIIHRDLKPENVFLVPGPDGQYHTKLLDFGIAKCIDAAGGARRKTATGVLLGTPGYMSPEQVKGARNVDHRADLWAVGVMFYEMTAAATPFPSDGDDPNNIWGLISAVLTKDPIPLSRHDPSLAPFDAFIARALSKDMTLRYGSSREMSDDLLRIARGERPMQLPQAQLVSTELKVSPINSRGELANIPAVHGGQGGPQSGRSVQHTPISGNVDPMAAANSTIPTGGGGGSFPAANYGQFAQTVPTPSDVHRQQVAPYAPAMAATALSPDGGFPQMVPGNGTAMTGAAVPQPIGGVAPVRYGTAPSGFAPPPQPVEERRSLLPWIALGVLLIGGLGAAIAWVLS